MTNQVAFMSNEATFSPDMQQFIEQTVELLKLDIVHGLAHEQEPKAFSRNKRKQTNPSILGKIVATHLKSLKSGSKYNHPDYSEALPINQLYNAETRNLARRHNINLTSNRSVLRQIDQGKDFAFILGDISNKAKISDMHANLFDTKLAASTVNLNPMASVKAAIPHLKLDAGVARIFADHLKVPPVKDLPGHKDDPDTNNEDATSPPIELNRGLKFLLHEVKCLDETNPEWPGDDEIAMGGVAVAPGNHVTKINEFRVGDSFDDGESKRYSPPHPLKNFNLNNVSYPADFLITLVLAEKDNGGLSDFITDLWNAIKDHVNDIMIAVGIAAGVAIGATVGGTTGTAIAGPLGAIIGIAAGAIIGLLVAWLINVLKDDIFTPMPAALRLPSADSTFSSGSTDSQIMTLNFRDHGGYYRAYYSWQIIK